MKKFLCRLCGFALALRLLVPLPAAASQRASYYPDLSKLLDSGPRRDYVQTMIGYYLRNDPSIRETLENGYSAVFIFEGASDNMADPVLRDISYYRVSAVCVALRLGETGQLYISYFNEDCSTLPDRPLEYGAWKIKDVGDVGPATVCDGTYELYSVKHGGKYEALHIRASLEDDTLPAVYMTPEGFTRYRADMINIHTRNVNHTIEGAMWSAGCLLVGDGDFGMFTELIQSTYYSVYNSFQIGDRVGTVTIDRQLLKEELYGLYRNRDAVDVILAESRHNLPETYLKQCQQTSEKSQTLWAGKDMELMSLPCSNYTDARSVPQAQLLKGDKLKISGSVVNSAGNTWYEIDRNGQVGYVFSGYAVERSWLDRMLESLFGE